MADVANLGLVRPPLVYLASIVLGVVLHLIWPARLVPASVSVPGGAVVTRLLASSARLSLWMNSLALLITLLPAVALMSLVVIPREERYLEARFPSDYLPYKASVRRWL